jgi:hypothetical protein
MVKKRLALFRRDISWPARTQRAQLPPDPFDLDELPDPAAVPPPLALCGSGITSHRPLGPLTRPRTPPRGQRRPRRDRRPGGPPSRWPNSVRGRPRLADEPLDPDSAITTRSRLSASTLAPHPTSHHTAVAALGGHPWMTLDRTPAARRCSRPRPPTIGQSTTATEHTQFRPTWRNQAAATGAPHRHPHDSATVQPLHSRPTEHTPATHREGRRHRHHRSRNRPAANPETPTIQVGQPTADDAPTGPVGAPIRPAQQAWNQPAPRSRARCSTLQDQDGADAAIRPGQRLC